VLCSQISRWHGHLALLAIGSHLGWSVGILHQLKFFQSRPFSDEPSDAINRDWLNVGYGLLDSIFRRNRTQSSSGFSPFPLKKSHLLCSARSETWAWTPDSQGWCLKNRNQGQKFAFLWLDVVFIPFAFTIDQSQSMCSFAGIQGFWQGDGTCYLTEFTRQTCEKGHHEENNLIK